MSCTPDASVEPAPLTQNAQPVLIQDPPAASMPSLDRNANGRRSYLAKYSQADVMRYPLSKSFGRFIEWAFKTGLNGQPTRVKVKYYAVG